MCTCRYVYACHTPSLPHMHTHAHIQTHTHSHGGKTVNFQINQSAGYYFLAEKNRFATVQDLIAFYHTNPIHSKQRPGQKILLVRPVPMDPALEAANMKAAQGVICIENCVCTHMYHNSSGGQLCDWDWYHVVLPSLTLPLPLSV